MKKKIILQLIGLLFLLYFPQSIDALSVTYKITASSPVMEGDLKFSFSKLPKEVVLTYNLNYADFVKEFDYMKAREPSLTISDYTSRYTSLVNKTGRSSIGDNSWRRNIGTDVNKLSFKSVPNYDTYALLDMGLRKGDIIYEGKGGSGFTGHIAMVDDIVTEIHNIEGEKKTFTYIRLIDAMSDGVVYSVLDDVRVNKQQSVVLRPKKATQQQMKQAFTFMKSQLGKGYKLNLLDWNSSTNRKDWYCSVLIWAAYKNFGIDLQSGVGIGITPREIKESNEVFILDHKFKLNSIDYVKNLTISEKGNRADNEDLAYEKSNPNYYRLYNKYYVLEKQKNGTYRARTSLYLGGSWQNPASYNLLGGLDHIEMIPRALTHYKGYYYNVGKNRDANYAFQWINYWSTSTISIIYSENITLDILTLNYNEGTVVQEKNKHGVVTNIVKREEPFPIDEPDYVKNLTISEKGNRANNEDLAYEKSNPNYYRLYNNYYVLEKQKNGTYRARTSLYLGGSWQNPASYNLLGGLDHIEMIPRALTHYKGYYYNVGKNRDANYAFQWINYWSTSTISIIYSENITTDIINLNKGTATVQLKKNSRGKEDFRVVSE